MPIAVGPLVFKSTHQGSVSALCNILNLTMSHDHPHNIINILILYSHVNNSYENCELEIKCYEYIPLFIWLLAQIMVFASGNFSRSSESPVVQCSISFGPVR